MKKIKIAPCLILIASLAACSSGDEKICKERITKNLLNPESVDFKQFEEGKLEDYWNNLGRTLGMGDAADILKKSGAGNSEENKGKLKAYRVRYQELDQRGNTETSVLMCLAQTDSNGARDCSCD